MAVTGTAWGISASCATHSATPSVLACNWDASSWAHNAIRSPTRDQARIIADVRAPSTGLMYVVAAMAGTVCSCSATAARTLKQNCTST